MTGKRIVDLHRDLFEQYPLESKDTTPDAPKASRPWTGKKRAQPPLPEQPSLPGLPPALHQPAPALRHPQVAPPPAIITPESDGVSDIDWTVINRALQMLKMQQRADAEHQAAMDARLEHGEQDGSILVLRFQQEQDDGASHTTRRHIKWKPTLPRQDKIQQLQRWLLLHHTHLPQEPFRLTPVISVSSPSLFLERLRKWCAGELSLDGHQTQTAFQHLALLHQKFDGTLPEVKS